METKNKMKLAGLLTLAVMPISSQASGYCYGYHCHEPQPPKVDNCSDEAIQSNLAKLSALNIVSVNGLAPFACYGYCVSRDNEETHAADKCEKAEALAKSVQLLAPLRVSEKQ